MSSSPLTTPNPTPTVVTVLGLGAMGLPMATRLTTRFTVHGFDVNVGRREAGAKAGVVPFESARAAAAASDVLLLAVRNAQQMESSLFGDEGVVSVLRPGCVVVLTSTVGTDAIPEIATRLASSGIAFVDAPLSGGPARAGSGDLLIVVGAEPHALELARPVLEHLASTLSIVGDAPGDGQALKTVNQLLCGVHIAAAAEALALADALGLDREKALAALEAGAAGSFMLSNRGPRMLRAYDDEAVEVLSRLDIFVKDMGIVGDAVRSAGLPSPLATSAEQLYLIAQAQGLGTSDDSSVIRAIAPTRRSSSK
jgi:3-hydroxyisobutyrate dehydrogenase